MVRRCLRFRGAVSESLPAQRCRARASWTGRSASHAATETQVLGLAPLQSPRSLFSAEHDRIEKAIMLMPLGILPPVAGDM